MPSLRRLGAATVVSNQSARGPGLAPATDWLPNPDQRRAGLMHRQESLMTAESALGASCFYRRRAAGVKDAPRAIDGPRYTTAMCAESLWYVAYGSNMDPQLLKRYLHSDKLSAPRQMRPLDVPRRIYFAGNSARWSGGVAFISLQEYPSIEASQYAKCVAYEVEADELQEIFRGENGLHDASLDVGNLNLSPNEWRTIAVPLSVNITKGKYNAVLRLGDIDGKPAYTFTTARNLELNIPSGQYQKAILSALGVRMSQGEADNYLNFCLSGNEKNSLGSAILGIDAGLLWEGELEKGEQSAGFPVVQLPLSCSPDPSLRLFRGVVHVADRQREAWVRFDRAEEEPLYLSPELAERLGVGPSAICQGKIMLHPTHRVKRISGRTGDIPDGDVIQVDPKSSLASQGWVLAVTPHFSAPVRIEARNHVPANQVRFSYAARQLLALDGEDDVVLQTISQKSALHTPKAPRWVNTLRDFVLGAPDIPLRATEGLVGDDGRMVVRVDSTALDFIGLKSGEEAIVSWATGSAMVRVLLQTPETVSVMNEQLEEKTGRQTRVTLTGKSSRLKTPQHLRAWTSSEVRYQLDIPPDTLIRIRRSTRHLMMRCAALFAFPVAGLLVAFFAIPSMPWPVWVLGTIFVMIISILPVRMSKSAFRSTTDRK